MKNRVLTALIAIPILLFIIYLSNIYLKILLTTVAIIAFKELFILIFPDNNFLSFNFIFSVLGIILLFLTQKFEIVLLIFIGFAIHQILKNNKEKFLKEVSLLLFSIIYASAGFLFVFFIRETNGFTAIIYILTTTWVCDTAAYFVGINFGKNKLAPEISPNKSVEGSIAGLAFSVFYSIIFYIFFSNYFNISIYKYILCGLIIGSIGQTGDLFESLIKRKFNVKDSGVLLPGHGGILDRCDSLIFNIITLYMILV